MSIRRVVVVLAVVALALGGATAGASPGPNGSNDYGLCNAYFRGSENGQDHKHNAGPFAALEEVADDGDDDTSPSEDVAAWCEDNAPHPGGQ